MAKAAPETGGQVGRKALDEPLAVSSTPATALFSLDDSSTNTPIRGGHQSVDGARCRSTRRLEQRGNVLENVHVVVVTHGYGLLRGHRLTLLSGSSIFKVVV